MIWGYPYFREPPYGHQMAAFEAKKTTILFTGVHCIEKATTRDRRAKRIEGWPSLVSWTPGTYWMKIPTRSSWTILSPLKPRSMENWKANIMLVKQCHNMSEASHIDGFVYPTATKIWRLSHWCWILQQQNHKSTGQPWSTGLPFLVMWYPYDFSTESAAPFFSPTLRCHQRWLAGNPPLMEDFSSDKNLEEGKNHMPKLSHIALSWLIWLINQSLFTFLGQETMTLIQKIWGVPFNISLEPVLGL